MMNHSSAIADENLFAATVILRMLEEMDGKVGVESSCRICPAK